MAGPPVLLDATVYIDVLQGRSPQALDRLIEIRTCNHSAVCIAELVHVEVVSNHADARSRAAAFVSKSDSPALVVAGGGGGTLRAVIEGICDSRTSEDLPGPQRVRVGALRMGSGNLLAKQFGIPRDPILAMQGLLTNLKAGRTAPCCVMECETWSSSGESEVHYAVSMGGLGDFGHVPADLEHWHARLPFVRRSAARLVGIEQVTNLEYALALFSRSLRGMRAQSPIQPPARC